MEVLVSHYQTVITIFNCMGIFIMTVYIATEHCPQDVDAGYEIMWPPTIINMNASNNCPDGAGMDR